MAENSDIQVEEPAEPLAARRSKRSTAGNRMAAALAEITLEELTKDIEDDVDFINDKDEGDLFESDFESTDEEAAAAAESGAGEKEIEDEERKVRKAARSRLERVTQAAHAKHKVTFNPTAAPAEPKKPKEKPKRRVSLGVAVDAETGEVMDVDGSEYVAPVATGGRSGRKSTRKHTMQNTEATVERLRESVKMRAAVPRKAKIKVKTLTQAELIARALDNEEGNIIEHRDYLKREEEKRKRARVVRTTVEGPLIRWISKTEQDTIIIQPTPPPAPQTTKHTSKAAAIPPPVAATPAPPTPAAANAYSSYYSAYSTTVGGSPYGNYNYSAYSRPYVFSTTPQQSTTISSYYSTAAASYGALYGSATPNQNAGISGTTSTPTSAQAPIMQVQPQVAGPTTSISTSATAAGTPTSKGTGSSATSALPTPYQFLTLHPYATGTNTGAGKSYSPFQPAAPQAQFHTPQTVQAKNAAVSQNTSPVAPSAVSATAAENGAMQPVTAAVNSNPPLATIATPVAIASAGTSTTPGATSSKPVTPIVASAVPSPLTPAPALTTSATLPDGAATNPAVDTATPQSAAPSTSALITSPSTSTGVPATLITPNPSVSDSAKPAPPDPPKPLTRIVTAEKNYVIHELGQHKNCPKPDWTATMNAMFGDHVDWDKVRVLVGKNRPMARQKQLCPITSKPAKYKDPASAVPFANIKAYQRLKKVLRHEEMWNRELGLYTGRREFVAGDGDADGDDAMDIVNGGMVKEKDKEGEGEMDDYTMHLDHEYGIELGMASVSGVGAKSGRSGSMETRPAAVKENRSTKGKGKAKESKRAAATTIMTVANKKQGEKRKRGALGKEGVDTKGGTATATATATASASVSMIASTTAPKQDTMGRTRGANRARNAAAQVDGASGS